MPRFSTVARDYLKELQRIYCYGNDTGNVTPELSYRTTIDQFIKTVVTKINPSAKVIHEPRRQGKAGSPDWVVRDEVSMGVYGYIEAKPLTPDRQIDLAQYDEQLGRYKLLGSRLVVTDGLEFVFLDPACSKSERVELIGKPVSQADWSKASLDPRLEIEFRTLLDEPTIRKCSSSDLVREVAQYAVELSKNAAELAGMSPSAALNDQEARTICILNELKDVLESHHDPALSDRKAFGDFVAQVLTFGLLYAHMVIEDACDPSQRYELIHEFWENGVGSSASVVLRPFRALISCLGDELNSMGRVGFWYDRCRVLLAYAHPPRPNKPCDYHNLYSNFLKAYDPQTKEDFGAYSTPAELASFMVRFVRELVAERCDSLPLYDGSNILIDPCCGTGVFLEALIRDSHNKDADSSNLHIVGFEILPVPYALAHYQLSVVTEDTEFAGKWSVVLTNTLSDDIAPGAQGLNGGSTDDPVVKLIRDEQHVARQICTKPIVLVLGNPPSSDSLGPRIRGDNFQVIQQLLDDFRPPQQQRRSRQNVQQQIQNEWMKFLRWACERTANPNHGHEYGIIALLLPSSFAAHESTKVAREWMLQHYDEIWVLDIDHDARTGVRTSNLFSAQQGRSVVVAIKDHSEKVEGIQNSDTVVNYGSLRELACDEKLARMDQCLRWDDFAALFEKVDLESGQPELISFRPPKPYDRDAYAKFWPLYSTTGNGADNNLSAKRIFLRHCSGTKLSPSALLVHASAEMLKRRTEEIADTSRNIDSLRGTWFIGQRKPPGPGKLTRPVRESMGRAVSASGSRIVPYSYRPFLNMYVLMDDDVMRALSETKGKGTRDRPELRAVFSSKHQSKPQFGFAVTSMPSDVASDPHPFVAFSWHLADNDLVKRGSARVCSPYFPDYKTSSDWDSTPKKNVHPELIQELSSISDTPLESIVFYSYAILNSSEYLDRFEGALFASTSSFAPRIPIWAEREVFNELANMGRELAGLENTISGIQPCHLSQDRLAQFHHAFQLARYEIMPNDHRLVLIGTDPNDSLIISDVQPEVLSMQMAGYGIIDQWLKYHSHEYYRKDFGMPEYEELLALLCRLKCRISIVQRIDDCVRSAFETGVKLVSLS